MEKVANKYCHYVLCRYCEREFDLICADWCSCGVGTRRPSKVCPHCNLCICLHPDYANDALWGDPPRFLKEHGFEKLFYLYL